MPGYICSTAAKHVVFLIFINDSLLCRRYGHQRARNDFRWVDDWELLSLEVLRATIFARDLRLKGE